MSLYHLNVTVHLLAALFWLGGMFFLALVGAPALRGLDDAELRGRLFADIGRRFRRAGWWAIGVLLVTGTLNLPAGEPEDPRRGGGCGRCGDRGPSVIQASTRGKGTGTSVGPRAVAPGPAPVW